MAELKKRRLGAVVFPDFELLDLFGPLEMFGVLQGLVEIAVVAEKKGPVASSQGPEAMARFDFDDCPALDLILVPGGIGRLVQVENPAMLGFLAARAPRADVAMSVCTGAALFARAGLLDGRRATTNKMLFQWVMEQGPRVEWVKAARWVEDGRFATSSGVSAGMDMALAIIERLYGETVTRNVAVSTEYDWHRDPSWDPFAKIHGLV